MNTIPTVEEFLKEISMKNNYTLILLKDGRNILVNSKAEEGIHPEANYFDNKVDKNNIYKGVEFSTENIILYYVKGVKDNFRTVHKIIAGIDPLPTLTYSDEVKQVLRDKYGWVDVEELAKVSLVTDKNYDLTDNYNSAAAGGYLSGFKNGVKAHQSITNKMFSLEEVKKAFFNGGDMKDIEEFNFFIQSLKQPIQLNAEVEMKRETLYTDDGLDYKGEFTPKITSNSILITKILN